MLENPRLPDDWDSHHYDNDNLVLYFTVPDDITTAMISGTADNHGTTELGTGLVVAGSGALATTAVSEGGLAALLSNPVSAIATLGATATGLSIYVGVENSIWLYKKITMALSKTTPSPVDMTRPGHSTDDEPRDKYGPLTLYHVTYITSSVSWANPFDTDLHHLIIKAYPLDNDDVAIRAVDRYLRDANAFRGRVPVDLFQFRTSGTRAAITEVIPLPISPFGSRKPIGPSRHRNTAGYYLCKGQMYSTTNPAITQPLMFVAPYTYGQAEIMSTIEWRWDTYSVDFLKPPYVGFELSPTGGCWRANGTTIPLVISDAITNYTDVL